MAPLPLARWPRVVGARQQPQGAARPSARQPPRQSVRASANKLGVDLTALPEALREQERSAEELMGQLVDRIRKTTAEECPFCADAPVRADGKKCVGVCRNPQNVPGPLVFPHEMQTAEDAVRLQMNAIRDNHVPRFNHGVQALYEFSVDAGNMERSRYFGFSADLYHFDHFMARALSHFGDLVDLRSYDIQPAVRMEPCGRTLVKVDAVNKVGEASQWHFVMVQRTFGKYKGCWQTHRLVPSNSPYMDMI